MPYLHCDDCHHEWESCLGSVCDWCGGKSHVLEKVTPLEKMIRRLIPGKKEQV